MTCLSQSSIHTDMRVQSFMGFACHTFYLLVPFLYLSFLCSCLVFQTGGGRVSIFPSSFCQTSPCILPRPFVFLPPLLPLFNAIFFIAFIFLPTSRGPSGLSINLLIFPCTGVRSTFLQFCCIFFWGLLFVILLVLFEPILLLLVSLMWPFMLCIFLVGIYRVHV